jgi:predicted metal-dependent phosphoesterase TrpH
MLNQDLIKEEKTPIPIEEILKLETEWPITRPDIANYLMKIWYVQTFQEAFDNWLRRYDVPLTTSDINQTIGLIRDIGWTSVLAHAFAPHVSIQSITKDAVQQIQILTELKKAWLHWLELYYSDYENNPHSQISHTINMADELNLLVTGGSDFHGGGRTGITLPWVSFPYHRVQTFLEEVHK